MDSSASDPSNPSFGNSTITPQTQPSTADSVASSPIQSAPPASSVNLPLANPTVYRTSTDNASPIPAPQLSVPAMAGPVVHQAEPSPLFDDGQSFSSSTAKSSSSGHKFIKILIIFLLVLFVGTFGVGSAAAAIAYGKLPINNPGITKPITAFILGLPFTPKTPDYILERAYLAEKNIKQTSFDASFATNLPQLDTLGAGLGKIDMEAKGAIDYADVNNVAFSLNSSVTRDFNFDLREKNQVIYFKVNQFPAALEPFFQATYGDMLNTIKQNWISFDVSSLDTAARRQLDAQSVSQATDFNLNSLLDKEVVSEMKLSDSMANNFPVYKISLDADDALVNDLGHSIQKQQGDLQSNSPFSNASNVIKNLKMSLLVDKSTFYIQEADISFDENYGGSMVPNINNIQTQVLGAQAQSIPVSMVIKLSDFNKPVNVDAPASSIPAEQLYTQLINQSLKNTTPPKTITQSTKLMKTQVKNQSDLLYWTNYLNQFSPLLH